MVRDRRWLMRTALACTLAGAAAVSTPAHADQQTVKLIQLLIQKGILSPGQAQDLLRETGAPPRGRKARAASPAAPLKEEAAPAVPPGQIRVTYVPQFIRKQIADEVRAQVMSEAQTEGWAAPDALPEWTKRFKIYGDLRMRYQGDFFDNNNYNQFVNFNSINNGTPYDINSASSGSALPPPFLNTTENRNLFRLRARLGVDAYLDDWVSADIRIGTGQDNGPVTPNQTLGVPGDFGKYALWLDRAYFKLTPVEQATVYAGRMNNPFLPSDLMFYPELGFDGIAAVLSQPVTDGLTAFGTVGVFPLSNTALDFSTNSDTKFASRDAYLAGIQAGARWKINQNMQAIIGVGLFDFLGVQGAVSSPCFAFSASTVTYACNTDNTKPPFLQFGNTLYAIRNIVPIQEPVGVTPPDPQYFGLASKFNVLDVHPRLEITTYHPFDIAIEGEFIKNLAYNRGEILTHGPLAPLGAAVGLPACNPPTPKCPITNTIGPVNNTGSNGLYQGGDTGYLAKIIVGDLAIHKRWDWNVSLSYRYLATDATLDSIADSDFHLGGTNAQGYIIGGSLGIARNTALSLRWLSAQAISGPHYGNDVLQFDLLSTF